MNRTFVVGSAVGTVAVLWAGALPAAPPPGFSAGPNPIFGSPGGFGPAQYIYPAPGVYGSTIFAPNTVPRVSTSESPYAVPTPPPEWPAVASARVTIRLPADAKLWADGKPTKQMGTVREFVTPPVLRAGLTYHYTFRAEWLQDGKPVVREQRVSVRATGTSQVDFNSPAMKGSQS
jgi:uncharacterized protein (TIGR03000 family)